MLPQTSFPQYKTRNRLGLTSAWDFLLIYTFLAVALKSLLLLAALHSPDSSSLNTAKTFFGQPPYAAQIAFILSFLALGLLFKNRARWHYYNIFNLLVSILLFWDLIYYRAYANFFSLRFLLHPNGFNPLSFNLWTFIRPIDFLFLIDLLVLGFLTIRGKSFYQNQKRRPIIGLLLLVLSVSFISYDHYRIDTKDETKGRMIFLRTCWVPFQTISNTSPIGYHVLDVMNLFNETKQYKLSAQQQTEVQGWFKQNEENLPDNSYKGMFKGKNLILIQVESLESFELNQKANGQEITPTLNRLLKNSLYFSNFYEQVNGGTSSDCDLLTATSTFPVRTGTNFYRYPTNSYNSLPLLFGGMGYNTISSHPEPAGDWNWIEAHHNIGYQTLWDLRQFNVDETIGLGLSDGSYMKQLNEKIAHQPQPFLLHFVTLTSHGPFDMPENNKGLKLDPSFDKTMMGSYFQAVNYTDQQIGLFLDRLDKQGLLDNTVVAIFGDHAGVHKFYQDKIKTIPLENEEWRTNTHKLPLIIYSKGMKPVTIPTIGGQVDTMPTFAYLMGIDRTKFNSTAMGKVLVNTNKNYTILNDGTVIGTPPTEDAKQHVLQSFQIADLVHESNYFESYGLKH